MISFMYIFCLLVWGLNFIAIKIQGTPVSLEESLTIRLAGAAILFVGLSVVQRSPLALKRRDLKFVILFGLCNFAISYLLLYYATIWSTAALVTLVFSMKAVMTPIALSIFLGDALPKRILIGGIIGTVGVVLLLYPNLTLDVSDLIGVGLAFAGTAVTAIGDATSARNARRDINPVSANIVGFIAATVFMILIVIFQGRSFEIPLEARYIGALLYLTVVASFLAWLFYLKLISRIGAATSSYMVALFPAVGGIASVALGESEPTIFLITGCTLSCIGAGYALGAFEWAKPKIYSRHTSGV